MKININDLDQNQFMVHPHIMFGETLWLVQPQHIGCKWTQDNKHLRSSVWNDDGELVSAGFPKFVNWGENPENFPVPTSLKNCQITEKLDGSLLIVSKYKGNYILRTRGTVDATKLDNGFELEVFRDKLLKSITHDTPDTWNVSLLFEWVSPHQRIILNYGDEPDWYMVGIVNHEDYTLHAQSSLDMWAKNHGFKRPPAYTFPTIADLMLNVEHWKAKEGVVVYSPVGMHKFKGLWYLALHRMKEALASVDKVIDVWYEQGEPSYQDFEKFIVDRFDWELWTQVQGDASRICDGAKEVAKIVAGMQRFVTETCLPLGDPKDRKIRGQMAPLVIGAYGKTNRANFVFTLLDGKWLSTEDRKKLLYQVLKQ